MASGGNDRDFEPDSDGSTPGRGMCVGEVEVWVLVRLRYGCW